jgi:hypothetical protein
MTRSFQSVARRPAHDGEAVMNGARIVPVHDWKTRSFQSMARRPAHDGEAVMNGARIVPVHVQSGKESRW